VPVTKIRSVNMVWGRNRYLFFRRVLNVVFFLLGETPASEFYAPTFRNTVCSIFIGGISTFYEDGTDSVPKRRCLTFRRQGITEKKEYKSVFILRILQNMQFLNFIEGGLYSYH